MNRVFFSAGAAALTLAAVAYPVKYAADVSTPEKLAAFADRAWFGRDGDNVPLWPAGRVPFRIHDDKIALRTNECPSANVVLTQVNDPYYRFFPAKGEGPRPCVVVCPGGGYLQIGMNKEGSEIADWLNALGFSAAVLAYRCGGQDQRDGALCDAQRTLRLLRRDAKRLGIDPKRLGMIGFSAGANLTVRAATNWRAALYARVDEADDLSCRPDFQLAIYPWDTRVRTKVGPDGWPEAWRNEHDQVRFPVDRETPPAFLVQTLDDFCEPATATLYDYALKCAGVDSTLKLYVCGGHGYGLRQYGKPSDLWPYEATGWLSRFAK